MNFYDVEAFVAVVETGSVVGASAKLHLTQPAVTRRIQSLERTLGESLLDRQSKPQKPTASGRAAYTLARQLLACADDLRHAVGGRQNARGEFRFGATHSLNDLTLVEAVGQLRKNFPLLVLHTSSDWSQALLQRVLNGELDAAAVTLVDNPELPDNVSVEHIGLLNGLIVGSKDDPAANATSLKQLSARPWVLNQSGCGMRSYLKRALNDRSIPFEIAAEASGSELQLALISRGVGLGVVTEPILAKSQYRKNLRAVPVRDFRPRIEVTMITKMPPQRLAQPIECLRQTLSEVIGPNARKLTSAALSKRV
jgi:DNA-binding transcriptional LysR family regulator